MDDRFQVEVLTSIANDYESLEQIVEHLRSFAPGMDATIKNISQALENLVQQGLAKAYVLSPQTPHVTEVSVDSREIGGLFFYVTPEGKKVVEQGSKLETPNWKL